MPLLPVALALSALLSAEPEPALPIDAGSPWELGVMFGGGWDSNPLAGIEPVGSGFAAARAWTARELGASQDDPLWLQLRYDGSRFDALPDADLHRAELSLEWGHRYGDAFTLRAIGFGALRAAGDPGRSGWDAGARAVARLRLARWFALRISGGLVWREASDPLYSGGTARLDGGVDADLWRGASVLVRYAVEVGTDAVYGAAAGTAGAGMRRSGTGGGGAMPGTPLSVQELTQTVSADVRQALGRGFFLEAGYSASVVRFDQTSLVQQQAVGGVGWSR